MEKFTSYLSFSVFAFIISFFPNKFDSKVTTIPDGRLFPSFSHFFALWCTKKANCKEESFGVKVFFPWEMMWRRRRWLWNTIWLLFRNQVLKVATNLAIIRSLWTTLTSIEVSRPYFSIRRPLLCKAALWLHYLLWPLLLPGLPSSSLPSSFSNDWLEISFSKLLCVCAFILFYQHNISRTFNWK